MVHDFAADLRRLRERAGRPPYRLLARRAHYSSSTLADAAAGRRLPSLAVTLAYVRACDGDTADWETRWRAATAEMAPDSPAGNEPAGWRGPYAGSAAFQAADAEWFFGRERLVENVLRQVRTRRFVAVLGASGSGKSSLLRAGVSPRLADVRPSVLMTTGPHPIEECATRIAAAGRRSAVELAAELRRDPRALHLSVLQVLADQPADVELVLVVDQFEEIFTRCADPGERASFIAALVTAASAPNSRTRVVVGMRADSRERCAEHPELVAAMRGGQVVVAPMTADELWQAITQPAVRAGCTVEGALLARVMADVCGQANVLPLVSRALQETWRRRRGNTLTLAGYEAAGGIRHALARTAESLYSALPGEQQRLMRNTLLSLVTVDANDEPARLRVSRGELACGDLETLVSARLVALDADTAEITHESLLPAWPRLRGWIDEDRAGLRTRRELSDAAAAWEHADRDPSLLYRGNRLTAARDHVEENPPPGDRIQTFLTASTHRQRRTTRLHRAAIAAFAILTLVAVTRRGRQAAPGTTSNTSTASGRAARKWSAMDSRAMFTSQDSPPTASSRTTRASPE